MRRSAECRRIGWVHWHEMAEQALDDQERNSAITYKSQEVNTERKN